MEQVSFHNRHCATRVPNGGEGYVFLAGCPAVKPLASQLYVQPEKCAKWQWKAVTCMLQINLIRLPLWHLSIYIYIK